MDRAVAEIDQRQRSDLWEADAKLVRATAAGSKSAQRELVERALPVARRTARYILRNSQDVDDAVQASLLALLEGAARFRGESSLGTWVTSITVRTALRQAQRQRTALAAADSPIDSERPKDESNLMARRTWQYLEQLPEPQRIAVVLRYGLDYRVDEIAEETESTRNTVKYRLKEALAKLRRLVRRDLAVRGSHE